LVVIAILYPIGNSKLNTKHSKLSIRRFYLRLVGRGKTKTVALIATMRKLLTILNTMLKKNESWNPGIA